METIKKLSQVRQGERVSITGKIAAADATVDAEGRVGIPWEGGGGCLTHDQDVTIMDDALEALRATPTIAADLGAPYRSVRDAVAAYEDAAWAARADAHRNFRTTAGEFVRCASAAARAADDVARTVRIIHGNDVAGLMDTPEGNVVDVWNRRRDHWNAVAMQAGMSA